MSEGVGQRLSKLKTIFQPEKHLEKDLGGGGYRQKKKTVPKPGTV